MSRKVEVDIRVLVALFVCAVIVTALLAAVIVSSVRTSSQQIETARYVVFAESTTYYAKDGDTGNIQSESDADQLINNLIDSAVNGSEIIIRTGDYYIDSPIIIDKSLSFVGEGVAENKIVPHSGIVNPDNPPMYLTGTVFHVTAENVPAIRVKGEIYSVIIKNIGIQFEVSDTLEGLRLEPAETGYGRKGLCYGEFDNIAVLGNDGNAYAFEFKNFLHIIASRLRSWGGLFMSLQNYGTADVNYGDSIFEECYCFTNKTLDPSKAIIWISTDNPNAIQNLILFERLDVNSHNGNTAYAVLQLESVSYTTFIETDIETDIHRPVRIEDNSDFVTFIGGLIWSSNDTSMISVASDCDKVSFKGMTLAVTSLDVSGADFSVETTEFKSENSGSTTINDSSNNTWVAHGLYATPTSIVVTSATPIPEVLSVTAKNSTHFQVTRGGIVGNTPFYWHAKV